MRLREVGTIAGCFLLLEAALWSPPPRQIVLGICSVLAMTVATFTRHVPLRELGLDASAWRRGAWIIAACSLAAIAMLTASFLFGTLQPLSSNRSDGFRSLAYAAWAFEQQFMLQSFIFVGMERALHEIKIPSLSAESADEDGGESCIGLKSDPRSIPLFQSCNDAARKVLAFVLAAVSVKVHDLSPTTELNIHTTLSSTIAGELRRRPLKWVIYRVDTHWRLPPLVQRCSGSFLNQHETRGNAQSHALASPHKFVFRVADATIIIKL